jgi:hypothetical protein
MSTTTGFELWRHTTAGGPLNFAHYHPSQAGFAASPVVTGDIVWIPHPDGALVAVAANDGHELWSTQLGAPVVSASDQGYRVAAGEQRRAEGVEQVPIKIGEQSRDVAVGVEVVEPAKRVVISCTVDGVPAGTFRRWPSSRRAGVLRPAEHAGG